MDPRLTKLKLRTLLISLTDLLMPRICLACGCQLLPGERHLCSCCLADLPLTHFEGALHNPMADKYNSLVCDAPAYERAVALFYYSGGFRNITKSLKYHRNFGAGRQFARMLGERMAAVSSDGFDLVCPVPLHWTRRFTRGYNQAEIIGREVARMLGVPFYPHLLRRVHRTGTQTRLSAEERSRNVAGAFRVRKGPTNVKSVLLIDDVFTTGATVAACDAALREAFGVDIRVSVATLAFAE